MCLQQSLSHTAHKPTQSAAGGCCCCCSEMEAFNPILKHILGRTDASITNQTQWAGRVVLMRTRARRKQRTVLWCWTTPAPAAPNHNREDQTASAQSTLNAPPHHATCTSPDACLFWTVKHRKLRRDFAFFTNLSCKNVSGSLMLHKLNTVLFFSRQEERERAELASCWAWEWKATSIHPLMSTLPTEGGCLMGCKHRVYLLVVCFHFKTRQPP